MDPIQVTIVVVSIALTITLVIIGIQVSLILKELRISVQKTNKMLDDTGKITETVSQGVTNLSGIMGGIKAGIQAIQIFKGKGHNHE